MFNFVRKKDKDEKEKKKKDKKDRKKQHHDSLSQDELSRLDEIRKSLAGSVSKKPKSPEKGPSGITADYRQQPDGAAVSDTSSNTSSTWSREGSVGRPTSLMSPKGSGMPPPLPSRPLTKAQKKSILKTSKSYDVSRSVSSELDDTNVLLRNTKDNEYVNVYRRSALNTKKGLTLTQYSPTTSSSGNSNCDFADRDVTYEMAQPTVKVRPHSDHVSPVSPLKMFSPIKVSALNGESVGVKYRRLSAAYPACPLPGLWLEDEAEREIGLVLVSPNDYGFSVKQCIVRNESMLLIESKLPEFAAGDQLVAVNGTNVGNMDRESVHKILKALGATTENKVTLQVNICGHKIFMDHLK
jgi:hypothetical protein